MQKFLTATITNGEKRIIPIHRFVSIHAPTDESIKINISQAYGYDIIAITLSAADPFWVSDTIAGIGSMVDILQKLVVKGFAQGNWSSPFLDITGSIPIPLESVTVSIS